MNIMIIPIFICLFGFLAYRKWSSILLGPAMALLLVIVCRLPMVDTMLGPYLEASASFVQSNFFVFFLGAIFGGIMEATGAAQSIALWMSKLTRGKFVLPLIMTITGILTYGGVSGFVVYFAMYPIALYLCKEANISRALIPGAIASGCWAWSMTMPGSPSIPNVVATIFLGTAATADLIPGFLIAGLLQYLMVFGYLEYQKVKYGRNGQTFVVDELVKQEMQHGMNKNLPHPLLAFLPLVLIVVLFNVVGFQIELALLIGVITGIIIFWKHTDGPSKWLHICNKGANNSAAVILNTAMVVGFAGVIKQTEAFAALVEWLSGLSISPLVYVAFTAALCTGAAASSSGGLGIALEAFKDAYMSLGIAPEIIHRVAVIAGGTLDSLPHSGGQITLLNICHQTHKDAYIHMFITECVIPAITVAVLIVYHMILG